MNEIIFYCLIGVLLLLMILVVQVNNKRLLKDLSKILYVDLDADKYIKTLDSLKAKFLLSKKSRLFASIDGYALKDDATKIEEVFNTLEKKRLSYGNKIGLYQKEVQFYTQAKMFDKAIKANETLQELGSKINDVTMTSILEEAQTLIEIYVNRNGDYAKIMVAKGDAATQAMVKGFYYYRAAKCYYFKADKVNTIKYLKECQLKCPKTYLGDHAAECLKDQTKIEEK